MNPIDKLIINSVKCTKCGACYGQCQCWEECDCGLTIESGKPCRRCGKVKNRPGEVPVKVRLKIEDALMPCHTTEGDYFPSAEVDRLVEAIKTLTIPKEEWEKLKAALEPFNKEKKNG